MTWKYSALGKLYCYSTNSWSGSWGYSGYDGGHSLSQFKLLLTGLVWLMWKAI